MKFDDYLNKKLKDPEVKKEFDNLTPEYEIISNVIKLRSQVGMTQKELAKLIGTNQSRISKLEKGSLNPSLDFLKKIAEGFNQSLHISFVPKG